MGEVLRQLVSKCLSSVVVPSVLDVLPPHQVGVGVRAGAEAVVHSLNLVRSLPDIPDSSKWVLLLNFKNAFNSIDRTVMFKEIRERLPEISPWMECCYGVHPLFYGDYTVHSCCGVQQGDPLGLLGFSLALQPIVDRITLEVPHLVMNSWYLDDGTLCGSLSDIQSAPNIIEEEGPSRGLILNKEKSLLFAPSVCSLDSNTLPSEIPVCRDGFTLLGSPVGSPDFCISVVRKILAKTQPVLDRLSDIEDSQTEYSILHSCLSLPLLSVPVLLLCSTRFWVSLMI